MPVCLRTSLDVVGNAPLLRAGKRSRGARSSASGSPRQVHDSQARSIKEEVQADDSTTSSPTPLPADGATGSPIRVQPWAIVNYKLKLDDINCVCKTPSMW